MGKEKRARMKAEKEKAFNDWWENLGPAWQSEIIEGYNTLLMKVPIACPTLENFKRRCFKIMLNLENNKFKKAFDTAEKTGNILLGKDK
jgi:hypothetical protein